MDDETLRAHIKALTACSADDTVRLTSSIVRGCWPGGGQDRTQPAALSWVRRWRPERLGATLVACSCADGRCVVCN